MVDVNSQVVQGVGPCLLDQLFPGWVVIQCAQSTGCHFLSCNGAVFFGLSESDHRRTAFHDLSVFVHPDEVDAYRRVGQKTDELLKSLDPARLPQLRFVAQYRLRRGAGRYVGVHEEKWFYPNDRGGLDHFTLLKDLPTDRGLTRVQLEWYTVHELGYRRLGTYVPTAPEQALTSREIEVVQLIREGLSSKEIAARLFISLNTVRNHRSNLFRKTNARNVVDLVTGITLLAESMN